MKDFIDAQGGLILTLVFAVTAVNLLLSGVSSFLDFVKDKTPTEIDNKIAVWVHKAVDVSKAIIDFLSANRQHK